VYTAASFFVVVKDNVAITATHLYLVYSVTDEQMEKKPHCPNSFTIQSTKS